MITVSIKYNKIRRNTDAYTSLVQYFIALKGSTLPNNDAKIHLATTPSVICISFIRWEYRYDDIEIFIGWEQLNMLFASLCLVYRLIFATHIFDDFFPRYGFDTY